MCLSPIRLSNPVKRISKYGGQSFRLEIPCGQCAECKEIMRTAWYFRSYYHCKEIYDKNGYVYFDTLTYSNDSLPYISSITKFIDKDSDVDYPCFDVTHYRDFFKEIRTWMKRNGYGNVRMTYFLTTEYGLNPKDGKTFRPHYHVLFFIDNSESDKVLDVYTLSKMVAHFWKYGRTDGLPYKSRAYVKKHTFGKTYCRDFVHMRSVCNYVSKYVTKDSDFQAVLEDRMAKIEEHIFGTDRRSYRDRKKVKDDVRKIKRSVDQFHRQSQHFGEYYLHNMSVSDLKQVLKTGMQKMPDKNSIVKHMPLDMYYKRKLFYTKKVNSEGQEYWTLTEDGKKWKLQRLMDSIDMMANKYDELFMNIPFFIPMEKADNMMEQISTLLDGRTFRDFAVYQLLYKGKTRYGLGRNNMFGFSKLHPAEDDLGVWMWYVISDVNELEDDELLYHYASQSDRERFAGSRFITNKNLGNKDVGYVGDLSMIQYDYEKFEDRHYGYFTDAVKRGYISRKYYGDVEDEESFVRWHCINENTDYRFRDFDKIYNLLNKVQKVYNEHTQRTFDFTEGLRKRWKVYREELAKA